MLTAASASYSLALQKDNYKSGTKFVQNVLSQRSDEPTPEYIVCSFLWANMKIFATIICINESWIEGCYRTEV